MDTKNILFLGIIISYLIGAYILLKIILENRDPIKTITWLLIFVLFPVGGVIIYAIFGRNLRKRKLLKTKKLSNDIKEIFENSDEINEIINIEKKELIKDKIEESFIEKKLITLLLNTGKFPFTSNNKIKVFKDGNEKFKDLLKDIENAKEYIHLEYFIIKECEIGNKLKEALIKKANKGLEIKLLYDDIGCWRFFFRRSYFKEMKNNNIIVKPFYPDKFPVFFGRINYRNHRKIVVIDGKISYMGGINVGDEYLGKSKKFGYWRDTHIKIEGTSTYMLQMIFSTDWYYSTKEVLLSKKYFPKISNIGSSRLQIVSSGPDSDFESIYYAYFMLISKAKKSIYIETPYFIPDDGILKALKSALLSGVDVKIIFPKIPDHKIVNTASYSYFDDILRCGGKVFLYKDGFIHSKLIIVDEEVASTGSCNMDIRSFMVNFEINTFIYDKNVVNTFIYDFYSDLRKCEELKLEDFIKRSKVIRFKESISRLFSPIL